MLFKKSLIFLCLLTMLIILSLDSSTNSLPNILLGAVNAQNSTDSIRGLQNGTVERSTADRSLIVKLLADNLENRLNKSTAILEITSRLPDVKNIPYTSSINPALHGIPKDLDISKRKVAQDILAVDKDLDNIFPYAKW
jgi:hypothetical protein